MGSTPEKTLSEIEATRDELARKVDELVDRAKVEAGEVGRKMAVGAAALAVLLLLSVVAKRRTRS